MGHRIYDFTVESTAPPEKFIAAATDFTERRLYYWPKIAAKRYRVHSAGDHVAEIDEGEGPIRNRVRYEWTDTTVRYVTLEANSVSPGDTWEMRTERRADGGTIAHLHFDFHWRGIGLLGQVMGDIMGTDRFFGKDMRESVRRIEAEVAGIYGGAAVAEQSL